MNQRLDILSISPVVKERIDRPLGEPTGDFKRIETQQVAPLHVWDPPLGNQASDVPHAHPQVFSDLADVDQPRQLNAAGVRAWSLLLNGVSSLSDAGRGRRVGPWFVDPCSVRGPCGPSVHAPLKVADGGETRHGAETPLPRGQPPIGDAGSHAGRVRESSGCVATTITATGLAAVGEATAANCVAAGAADDVGAASGHAHRRGRGRAPRRPASNRRTR